MVVTPMKRNPEKPWAIGAAVGMLCANPNIIFVGSLMTFVPVLWSFRRCPYAMRARLAVQSAGIAVDLRDILLKEKPEPFLAASAKGTVPVLETEAMVIAESRDIMIWALTQCDPENWLRDRATSEALIDENDGPFKTALDHTKYAVRFPERDAAKDRAKAAEFLFELEARLKRQRYLLGDAPALADAALRPFVRQFANTDRAWFDAQDWPHLIGWLTAFESSERFQQVMAKRPLWVEGAPPQYFP